VEKKTITLKDVHELIDEKCVQACQQAWVKKPLAWALYQVWREVDAKEEDKNERENYK
jgi:hypothetical protein